MLDKSFVEEVMFIEKFLDDVMVVEDALVYVMFFPIFSPNDIKFMEDAEDVVLFIKDSGDIMLREEDVIQEVLTKRSM